MVRRWLVRVALIIASIVAPVYFGVAAYKTFRWKRWAVVEEGEIYRSGRLADWQLAEAIERYDLETVVCFDPKAEYVDRQVCDRADVDYVLLPMPSDGRGRPEQFREALTILSDETKRPVLIHCHAGVARTGAVVALHRMRTKGWTLDEAIEELRTFERKGRISPELHAHLRMLSTKFRETRIAGETKTVR